MKAHFDIMQGSGDWFNIRYGKIGGSTSKGLFVKSDTLMLELLAELTEDRNEDEMPYQSDDMIRGSELEPEARELAQKELNLKFKECGWIQSDIDLLGISPDGITEDLKDAIEIKCPRNKKHLDTILKGEIPSDNIHQCVHYFTVNPQLERLHFVTYRPENYYKTMFIRTITRFSTVNIGTDARPVLKTVQECTQIAISAAKELQKQLNETLTKLQF